MGYGPTATKKRIDKQAVYHAAMLLIQSNGQTTSLEVKTELRSLGFFAEQAEVSAFLQELQTEHSWEKETVGSMPNQHFAYSTTTSKQAVAQPTQTATQPVTHINTPLENEVIQLIKDTVWNRTTPPAINVNSVLQKELGLDHLNMIQIGLAVDAKYKTKTMKEDWSPILTVSDVVAMMLRLDPSLNSAATTASTFNAVLSPAYDGVRTVLSDKLGLLKSEILLASTMKDLEVDSLDLVEIAMELEMQFNIAIPDDALESVTTVDGLVRIIDGLIGTPAPVQTSHAAQTSTPGTTIGASTAGNGKVKIPRKAKSVINDSATPSTSPRVTVNIDPISHVNSVADAKSGYDGNSWFAYVKNESDGFVYDGKYTSDNIRTVFARKKGIKIQDVRASRVHRM